MHAVSDSQSNRDSREVAWTKFPRAGGVFYFDLTDSGPPYRVVQGGSFGAGPAYLLSSYRRYVTPLSQSYDNGARCARTL